MSTDRKEDAYFATASGVKFYPFAPRPGSITIEDIATGLAGTNRFGGHQAYGNGFYSVAEHSILVSRLMPLDDPELQLQALLHDASEGLGMSDVLSPVKRWLPEYKQDELRLQSAVYKEFGLTSTEHALVKEADYKLLTHEQLALGPNVPWLRELIAERGHEPLGKGFDIWGWYPMTARIRFMDRYTEIMWKMKRRDS